MLVVAAFYLATSARERREKHAEKNWRKKAVYAFELIH